MRASRATADLILHGGPVFTVDAAQPWAQTVAIRQGRIVAVGSDSEVAHFAGGSTELLNLDGRLVVPGFQDAHLHAVGGGLDRIRCDLGQTVSTEERRRAIAAYAQAHPDDAWLRGLGLDADALEPGAVHALGFDEVVPDRPAVLFDDSGFRALANGPALRSAGLDGPAVLEGERLDALREVLPPASDEELRQGLLAAQRHLHSLGITAWQDAGLGAWSMGHDIYDIGQDTYDVHRRAAERDELTAHVVGAIWWDRDGDETQIETFLERRGSFGRFRVETVKIQQDGICDQQTAAMLEPYSGEGGTGFSFVDPAALQVYAAQLARAGFQLHLHGIGDRGIRECLDALAAARRANGGRELRHHIAHVHVPHPSDLARFRELDVTATMQPLWGMRDREMVERTIPLLGPERAERQYPIGSLRRAGARLAFGTDWAWSSADPLWGIHVAVNRTPPPGFPDLHETESSEPLVEAEAIRLGPSIAAYTLGSAYVNNLDGETGSIEVGKRADLVVLDRNPFDLPAMEIGATRVALTLIDGAPVYDAAESSAYQPAGR